MKYIIWLIKKHHVLLRENGAPLIITPRLFLFNPILHFQFTLLDG
jgi:hypothetical protein